MLEQDKTQKEADIKIRNTEVATLQKELDAISSTLKQLENQKGEAQKRLDDLDDKVRWNSFTQFYKTPILNMYNFSNMFSVSHTYTISLSCVPLI